MAAGSAADEADEAALIQAAAGGEGAAFARLVALHADRAFAVAFRLTGGRSEAEDVVQEAFIRAWAKLPGWRTGGARFGTWLHRVVVNLCLDRHRARRHRRFDDLEAAAEIADPAPDALTSLGEAAERAGVLAAVRALPDRQRAALALTYAGERSNAEVAAILEISVGAVESLLVRARRELRRRLRAEAEGEA